MCGVPFPAIGRLPVAAIACACWLIVGLCIASKTCLRSSSFSILASAFFSSVCRTCVLWTYAATFGSSNAENPAPMSDVVRNVVQRFSPERFSRHCSCSPVRRGDRMPPATSSNHSSTGPFHRVRLRKSVRYLLREYPGNSLSNDSFTPIRRPSCSTGHFSTFCTPLPSSPPICSVNTSVNESAAALYMSSYFGTGCSVTVPFSATVYCCCARWW